MKIKAIRAFEIELNPQPTTPLREPSRADTIKMTRPIARYAGFKSSENWASNPQWKRPAVIVTAEDGTWGFGLSVHGGPVVSLINGHFAPFLVGENCMATEKLWDMMARMAAPYGST